MTNAIASNQTVAADSAIHSANNATPVDSFHSEQTTADVKVNQVAPQPAEEKNAAEKVANNKGTYKAAISLERATDDENSIEPRTRPEYVAAFNVGAAKTARATLEMCRVVYEAFRSLDACGFSDFCHDIGSRDTSSTIRKYIAIGKVYPRLIEHAERLPSAWTSIYAITQIPADTFEKCVSTGYALKNIKGKELVELVKSTKEVTTISEALTFNKGYGTLVFGKLYFTKKPDLIDWRAMQKALGELESRLPIKFVVSAAAEDSVAVLKDARYSAGKEMIAGIEFKPEHWDLGREAYTSITKKAFNHLYAQKVKDGFAAKAAFAASENERLGIE